MRYYASPKTSQVVRAMVGLSWISCMGMVMLVPTDVQISRRVDHPKAQREALAYLWNMTFW